MYKLIRDKIPEIMKLNNETCNYATVQTDGFYKTLLKNKLVEEIKEYIETDDLEELADILTVINTIISLEDKKTFKETYNKKLKNVGGFKKRYVGFFNTEGDDN